MDIPEGQHKHADHDYAHKGHQYHPRETIELNIDNLSEMKSQNTSKSYARILEKEIGEERRMLVDLGKQIEEIKKFNKSVTSKLGIDVGK